MDSAAVVEIKSKFGLEFRRISLLRRHAEALSIDAFYRMIMDTHCLPPLASVQIFYLEPRKNQHVPINDAKELATAVKGAAPLLRLFVNRIRGAEAEVSGSEEEEEEEGDHSNGDRGGRGGVVDKGNRGKGGLRGGGGGGGGGRGGRGGREGCTKTNNGGGEMGGKEQARSTQHSNSPSSPCSGNTSDPSLQSHRQETFEEQRHPHETTGSGEDGPIGAHDRTATDGGDGVSMTNEEEGRQPLRDHSGGTDRREGEKLRVMDDMLPKHPLVVMFEERRSRQRAQQTMALTRAMNCLNLAEEAASSSSGQIPAHDWHNTPESQSAPMTTGNEDDRFPFVIEIYGFDPALKTKDILREFQNYKWSEFRMKWVDDTHAIGIFASARQAWLAAGAPYTKFKTRMVKDGTEKSISMAEKLAEEMRPLSTHARPKTTAMVARRMVSSALGVRVQLSPVQREKERRELREARERKAGKQRS